MRWLAWISAAAAMLWVAMSLTYPFGWDQGLFAWAGGVIVHGGLPYVDAWDMKGPLVYYLYAVSESLFGVHLWSVRVLDVLFLLTAALALLRVTSALTDRATAKWAALVLVLWYASQSYWHTAQPDGWTGMLLIIGLAPILGGAAATPRMCTFVGIAVGLTALFKPLWVVFIVMPLIYVVMTAGERRARAIVWLLLGWVTPVALAVIWFAIHGGLGELTAVHVRYSAFYAGVATDNRLRGLIDYLLTTRVTAVAVPFVVFGAVALWRTHRAAAIILVAWIAIVAGAVVLQGRFFAYHWLPLLPAATVLGAAGLFRVRAQFPALAAVACTVIVLHCLAPVVLEESRFLAWVSGRISTEEYYDAYGGPGDDMKAVRWLRDSGRPGDVYVFGWEGGVAWLSGRRFVSRFGFSMPLMIETPDDRREGYRSELMTALSTTPPRFILVGTQSDRILGRHVTLGDFPELATLVAQSYRESVRFGKITIFERQ